MAFKRRTIRVNGVDLDVVPDDLEIRDIDKAQRHSARMMAFWASVAGAAQKEHAEADAYYRQWRARLKLEVLESDPKLADHKINARIEASDEFYALKSAVAKALDNKETADKMYGAWEKRVNAAQSLGARERGEAAAYPKEYTRTEPRRGSEEEDSSPRKKGRTVGVDPDKKKRLKSVLKGRKDSHG